LSHAVRAAGGGRKKKDALLSVGDPTLTRVAPPEQLRDEDAVHLWKAQSKIMISRGTLSREDLPILVAYCNAWSLMIQSQNDMAKTLYSSTADGGEKVHPSVNVNKIAVSQLKMLGSLLGLDPLSRARVVGGSSGGGGGQEENPFENY
jgi:P27 family predicted phage terminase small subunit